MELHIERKAIIYDPVSYEVLVKNMRQMKHITKVDGEIAINIQTISNQRVLFDFIDVLEEFKFDDEFIQAVNVALEIKVPCLVVRTNKV